MKRLPNILLVVLGVLLAVLYFSSDFALIDIEKTAIVVAIGIDKADEGYKVTAQIAIPQATDATASNEDAVMSSTGKTVDDAIYNIGTNTGWHPKLSFCSMIFLSRDLASEDVENIIDYLISTERVQNSAIIAMSDGKAEDLLFAKTPLDSISSFALQKIVLKTEWMVSTVGATNLKKFAVMNYSKSKSGYMPVIKTIRGATKGKDDGQQGASSDNGGGKSENEEVLFDSSSIALFSRGKLCGELSEMETSVYYLLNSRVYTSFITVSDQTNSYFLQIDTNSYSMKVDPTALTVDLKLDMRVSVTDSTAKKYLTDFNELTIVEKKVLDATKEQLESVAESLIEKIKAADSDIFFTKEYVYKYDNSNYYKIKDLPTSAFSYKIDITVRSSD